MRLLFLIGFLILTACTTTPTPCYGYFKALVFMPNTRFNGPGLMQPQQIWVKCPMEKS